MSAPRPTAVREPVEHLTATVVAGSVSLLEAVLAERRSRLLATALMLMSFASDEAEPAARDAA